MKNAMITLRSWLLLITVAVVSSVAVFAAVPSAPQDLQIFEAGGSIPDGSFLYWEMDDTSSDYNGFNIYIADGHTQDMSSFSIHDSLSIKTTPNGHPLKNEFFHILYGLDKGDYTVYITALNPDGESAASNLLPITVKGGNWDNLIYFTEDQPESNVIPINEIWSFKVKAESKGDITIKYELREAPQGMTIDENTGLITWTPSGKGTAEFMVVAYEDGNANNLAYTYLSLYVKSCSDKTMVSGTIREQDGTLLKQGTASLIEILNDKVIYFPGFDSEIIDGKFEIDADEGNFYILVYAPGYRQPTLDELLLKDPFVLNCGSEAVVDITLNTKIGNPQRIYFTTFPESEDLFASLNSTWTYDADAESEDDSVVVAYKLHKAPEGMTIDANTGLITWTATETGNYTIAIIAYEVNNESNMSMQQITIFVRNCSDPILVSGTVTFDSASTNQEPINKAYAVLLGMPDNDSTFIPGQCVDKYGSGIVDGKYEIQADAGKYILWFRGFGQFEDEFWNNTYKIEDATIIELECSNTYTFDASVEKYATPEHRLVSGQVTDEDTEEGIPYAFVEFTGSNSNGMRAHSVITTDQHGMYEISLDDRFDYIARASTYFGRPGNPHDTNDYQSYIPEYYNDVTDYTEAELLIMDKDYQNIDFALSKVANYDNSISGIVIDKDNNIVSPAWVMAFLVESGANNNDHINWGFTATTDDLGAFQFHGLIPGEYILLAFPEDIELAPGYYVENDFASLNWKEATRITATSDSHDLGNVIKLENMKGLKGVGIIKGKISKKGKNGGMVEGDADPINGALVYTLNEEGQIVKFERTNSMGDFQVDGLPNGRYHVLIEKVGFDQLSLWVDIDNNTPIVDITTVELTETPTSVTDGIFAEISLFPNPAVTTLTVNLGTLSSNADIQLIDASGVTLYKGQVASNENHKIDVNGLTSGMYYLKVTIGEELTVLPVAINK